MVGDVGGFSAPDMVDGATWATALARIRAGLGSHHAVDGPNAFRRFFSGKAAAVAQISAVDTRANGTCGVSH